MIETHAANRIDFAHITLQDRELYESYLAQEGERGCEFSFANLYLWGRQKFAVVHGHIVLFSQFDRFKQGFLQSFLRNLYIVLWSLLFVIPGIVKSFSYAMTPFIMADHPEMTAKEAIAASKEMMDGHKGDLFILGLTFFGWHLLAGLSLGIGYLWLNPYMNAAYAAFYRDLCNQKRIEA